MGVRFFVPIPIKNYFFDLRLIGCRLSFCSSERRNILSITLSTYTLRLSKLGVNIRQSIETLQNDKPHIVVGTPGRILDLSNRGALDLSKVNFQLQRNQFSLDQTLRHGRM